MKSLKKGVIEIFTAGCPICNPVVDMVRIIAQDEFEIVEYNLIQLFANKDCLERVEKYGVKRLPSIALNGKLLSCCGYTDITKETLMNGGIG